MQCAAFDFVYDEKNTPLVEVSYGFIIQFIELETVGGDLTYTKSTARNLDD
jgi:hypothetical protein